MNFDETAFYGLTDDDWVGCFYDRQGSYDALNERIGSFNDKKGNRIDIFIKEAFGNTPHIHLRDHEGQVCRIKLRESEYQRDAYEKAHPHSLKKNELYMFNEYMHEKSKDKDCSNWYRISSAWNDRWRDANPGKTSGIIDLNKGCPDYINIKEPK